MTTLQPVTADDFEAIGALSRAVGQPPLDSGAEPAYLAHVLATGRALMATADGGRVVGWGAVRTGELGSMLTDLFVDPSWQGRGVGRQVLGALWPDGAASGRYTFSSQHPNALSLYTRCGLRPGWPLLYLRGPRPHYVGLDVHRVPASTSADVERRLTGADRRLDHDYWTRRPGSSGVIVRHEGEPIAAAAAGADCLHHLVAVERPAKALLAVLTVMSAETVTVRLPGPHPAVPELLTAGFRIEDFDVSMTSPDVTLPLGWAYSPAFG